MYENLRKLRKEKKIKVSQICEILDLKVDSAYYKKESGRVPIKLEEGLKIAKLFNMSIEEIFLPSDCLDKTI